MNLVMSILFAVSHCFSTSSDGGGLKAAIDAMQRGENAEAVRLFTPIADAGDSKAQVTLGLLYYKGEGLPVDYVQSKNWFLRAFEKGNGDAYSNLGVMFRDGKGVEVNRRIAYALFLMVHMEGRGTEDTQYRAGSNLSRLVHELSSSEQEAALCQPYEWVMEYVRSSGRSNRLNELAKPTPKNPRLKDAGWWVDGELKSFQCTE